MKNSPGINGIQKYLDICYLNYVAMVIIDIGFIIALNT